MKKKTVTPIIGLMVIGILFLFGCSGDIITAPEAENQLASQQNGIPTDQLNLVSWNAEISYQLQALGKKAYSLKHIQAHNGGTVGGEKTFGNKVDVPANALSEDTWISVEVSCVSADGQCGAVVEFLPSMQFQLDVTVTLSYDVLDFNGDPNTLKVVWYDETTGLWVEVDGVVIDEENRTVSVQVDHFTRWAWAL